MPDTTAVTMNQVVSSQRQPAPDSTTPSHLESEGVNRLTQYDDRKLKTMYRDSRSLTGMAILSAFGCFICSSIALMPLAMKAPASEAAFQSSIFVLLAAIFGVLSFMIGRRRASGRTAAIGLSALMMAGFPLGTIFGLLGLLASLRTPELCGDSPIRTGELKRELKERRKMKKLAKKRIAAFE